MADVIAKIGAKTFDDTTGVMPVDADDIPEKTASPVNLYLTAERVQDIVAAFMVAGTGVTLTYNDAANTLTVAATGGAGGAPTAFVGVNDQTVAYTLVLADAGKDVRVTSATAVNVTIPPNSSVAFANAMLMVSQGGAGVVTVVAGAGVTLRAPNGASTSAIYDARGLEQIGTNEWRVW
jgi:hypothetical protein